jgi:hypothetical protein
MTSSMDLHGSISAEEKTFIETWENVGQGTNYIIRENRRGDEVQTGITGHGMKFRISTYERMLTEEKALDPRNNPFKNGVFRPVIVPQGVDIETNPNALSDDDIERLFASSEIAWDEYMNVIDSPATLKRMIDMAENSGLSLRRFRQLEGMYEEFSNIGKRVVNSNADIQKRIDDMGGPGGPPPSGTNPGASATRSVGPTKAAPAKAAPAAAPPAAT